jgi:hypothetical protein
MKPKIKILYEYGFDGEYIKEDELAAYLVEAVKIALKNPDAKAITVNVDGLSWSHDFITFFVIYKKLDGVKRVTNRDIVRAIQDQHEGQ